ncbi:type II secretion system protein [Helicobacter anatolicus]|uniref:type II secretion system protein n=1 Tax=Helicobacter anatolicus TaxID=2905874 RepID=UPI001E55BA4F|nr:type II secretion system protein [Helicobacter anatolicus]MCE3038947.1 type II secretion system GspH family protein [Helicobacter anatolicus]
MKKSPLHSSKSMQPAFSMIELVFVIVILGIIASIAIPRFSLTRSDAQYAAILADTQNILNAMQQKFILEDLQSSQLNGNTIMQTTGLSPTRWIATNTGVKLAKNNAIDMQNNCLSIDFISNNLVLKVDSTITSPLCQKLLIAYPTPITIPLETSSIKF